MVLGGLMLIALGLLLAGRIVARHERAAARSERPVARTRPRPETPQPKPAPEKMHAVGVGARVAIVIDDLGRSEREIDRLEALHVPLTYSLLPYAKHTREIAERLRHDGAEVMCHLPMEPTGSQNPGPHAIWEGVGATRIEELTRRAIEAVPGAVGLNNHMGSLVTADEHAMRAILGVVRRRGLFFVDSRTSPQSRAFDIARDLGIPAAKRNVFLDDERNEPAVTAAFYRLLDLAHKNGAAIGIGHPHDVTLTTLAKVVPRALAAGYEFVPVSFLLERNEGLPE